MAGLGNYPQVSQWDQQLQQLGLQNVSPFNVQNQMNPSTPPAKKIINSVAEPSRGERQQEQLSGNDRNDPMKNYGYISKPSWMEYASFVPGLPGLAAKVANVGINANNAEATDTARTMLGLDEKNSGFMGGVKGAMKDNKGQVADVKIGDPRDGPLPDYSVGFEAMSPQGRTNLTPQEASRRANTLGGLTEIDARPRDNSQHESFINEARDFFDSLFDHEDSPVSGPKTTDVMPQSRPTHNFTNREYGTNAGDYSGDYSGLGGDDSPSEHGPGPGMGLGGKSTDKDKDKNK